MTGGPDEIVLESRPGGQIYETSAGVKHTWGEVTVWEPPRRLAYLWHLGRDRAEATEVEIRFVDEGGDRTRIEIEHSGWERLGDDGGHLARPQPRRLGLAAAALRDGRRERELRDGDAGPRRTPGC